MVDHDSLAAEHVDRLAVEAEDDALHARELRDREGDLGEPRLHRRAAAARLELRGEVDAGDPVVDREPEELRPVGDRRPQAVPLLEGVGPLEQRLERGGADPRRRGLGAIGDEEALVVREPHLVRDRRGRRLGLGASLGLLGRRRRHLLGRAVRGRAHRRDRAGRGGVAVRAAARDEEAERSGEDCGGDDEKDLHDCLLERCDAPTLPGARNSAGTAA